MKLKYWMTAKAAVEIVFGIGFVLIPVWLGSLFGLDLNPSGALMAQLFGTAFIFSSMVLFFARNMSSSGLQAIAIILAVAVSNAIGFVVTLMASQSGVWNALGWLPVTLYLVFALVFVYFLFAKK